MLHLVRLPSLAIFCALTALCVATCPVSAIGELDHDVVAKQTCIAQLPLEKLSDPLRTKLTKVLQQAQMFERSKTETFPCNPEIYRWLLDSPDASLFAWRKLGATKATINRLETGAFLGSDGAGGELRWHLIATGPLSRIWYAEGSGRIGPLLPTMTIKAVVFLNFQEVKGTDGRTGIKHRIEFIAHYDSNALVNKLTNMSAETTGKKAAQQLEMFFSGMAWYVSEHAAWSKKTFTQWASTPNDKDRLKQLIGKLEPADDAVPPLPTNATKQVSTDK